MLLAWHTPGEWSMQRIPRAWLATFTLLLAAAAAGPAADTSTPRTDRAPAVRDEPLRQYRAYRRLHARSERLSQEGWLEAWTEFDERGFRYEIVRERGSEQVRNRVLRAVLKREQELLAEGDTARGALTAANYHFGEAVEENGLRYVPLKPKRKDTLLVDGYMVMSPDDGELLRVEGRLARNPSFWTSLVRIIRHYTRLDGVRVPIAAHSMAKLKFAGEAQMDVRYEYASINGRPVSFAARRVMASAAWRD
jgi:hypothetical protein